MQDVFTSSVDVFFISLKIWNGDKTSIPVDAVIDLALPPTTNVFDSETSEWTATVSFEISKYLESYIDDGVYIQSSGTNYNGDNAVWYQYSASASGSGGGNFPVTSSVKLATSGVGYTTEGSNPGTTVASEDGKVFGNHSKKLIADPNGSYLIPVYIGDNSNNEEIRTKTQNITITSLGFTLNSINSGEQIAYIPLNSSTFGSEWATNKEIKYQVYANIGAAIYGLSFNGIDTYIDLGIVPLLNSSNSYVKTNFRAYNWESFDYPFGYFNSSSDRFYLYRASVNEERYGIQSTTETIVTPTTYPNPDTYQEVYVNPNSWSPSDPSLRKARVVVGGTDGLGGTLTGSRYAICSNVK